MDLPEYVLKAGNTGIEDRLYELAKLNNLHFVSTKRFYNTRLAYESIEYARLHGQLNEFHKAVFDKVYGKDLDSSSWQRFALPRKKLFRCK